MCRLQKPNDRPAARSGTRALASGVSISSTSSTASASVALFVIAGVAQIAIAAGERLSDAIPQVGLLEWPFLIGLLVFYATYHLKRWRGA